jgi:hypothetical protein
MTATGVGTAGSGEVGRGVPASGLQAIVVFGDVVGSRAAPAAASAWLRQLRGELDGLYGDARLAPFAFTQGDELQGLLAMSADPLRAVLHASLHPEARAMRWAVVTGRVEDGEGAATERSGAAFVRARQLIAVARTQRDGLLMETADGPTDALLADVAPVLADLLSALSTRQRLVARMTLLDGLRQVEIAARLEVSRATVSVTASRAGTRSIARLAAATRAIWAAGVGGGAEGAA